MKCLLIVDVWMKISDVNFAKKESSLPGKEQDESSLRLFWNWHKSYYRTGKRSLNCTN